MAIFGIDLSHFQSGLNIGTLVKQGYTFFAPKCTEGTTFADPDYATHLAEAKKNNVLFAAYHFLRSDSPVAAQADWLAKHIIDKSIPVMIDCEPSGGSRPHLALAAAFRAECKKRGITVSVLYFPHFWWTQVGSPSLKGWQVWQAEYPSLKHDYASNLYQKDSADSGEGWAPQGGVVPAIWQFASSGLIDGYPGNVDVDAFRGTRADLAALGLFKDFAPVVVPDPKPAPKPKPVPATRLQQFHAEFKTKNVVDLNLLDAAIKNGRTGTVKTLRDDIVSLVEKAPAK